MNVNPIFKRTLALLLVLIMTMSDCITVASYAVSEITSNESSTDDTVDVGMSDEVAASFTQTMEELYRLMEAGQVMYDETSGMLVLTDPNADLSGLTFSDITAEPITDTALSGAQTDALPTNVLLPVEEDPSVREEGTGQEDLSSPSELLPSVDQTPSADESILSGEEFLAEEALSSETDEPSLTPDDPASEEQTPPAADTELTEESEDPTVEETPASQQDPSLSDDASDSDPEADLLLFSNDCDRHVATKKKSVPYYNKYEEKNQKKKGTITGRGTLLEVVDSKRTFPVVGTLYYKVVLQGVKGDCWVKASDVEKHKCTEATPNVSTDYTPIKNNNGKHNKITKTSAILCKTCKCKMESADTDTDKQNHSWNELGVCTKCGYNFIEEEKTIDYVRYVITSASAVLHKTPYSKATSTRTLNKGDTVTVISKTKNAKGNWWYKTNVGDWIWEDHIEKHSKHEYASSDGYCQCGARFSYDIKGMTSAAYHLAVDHDAPIREYPYASAKKIKSLTKNQVIYLNGYTYPDPNPGLFSKGPKWYRVEGGGWIKTDDIALHSDKSHKYAEDSEGKCTFTNCKHEKELSYRWLLTSKNAVAYETQISNVAARTKPYSTADIKEIYSYRCQVLQVDQYVTNAQKEIWYRTTNGHWIKKGDIKEHAHQLSVGVCTSPGCSYVSFQDTRPIKAQPFEVSRTAEIKDKPFADAKTVNTLPPNTCLTINACCVVEGESWYRTVSGQFVPAACLKVHAHNYKKGYCAPCGGYKEWKTTTINPLIVTVKNNKTKLREKPYSVAADVGTLSAGDQIVIVQQCKNGVGNIWYQLNNGKWIYSDSVKTTNGGTVKTSSKLSIDKYMLTLVDYANNPISGAKVEWVGDTYTSDENGLVTLAYVKENTTIVISKDKYDTVTLTDHKMNTNRKESVTMSETGRYEAIKVTMNYLDKDINVLRTAKSLNQYHTQGFFDNAEIRFTCEVSDSVKPGKFVLEQGKRVIATSTDGVFTGLDVQDFVPHKTIYLLIYDKTGQQRSRQKLLIDIYNEGMDGTTPAFNLGLGKLSLQLPAKTPLIGAFKIEIDPGGIVDLGMDIDDDSTKISLNINAKDFVKKISKGTPPDEKENWFSFQGYADYWKAVKEIKDTTWRSYSEKKIRNEKNNAKWGWTVDVGGYVEKMHGESIYHGKIYVSIAVKWSDEANVQLGPVPLVLELTITGKTTVGGKFTIIDAQVTDITVPLDISVAVEGAVGVGFKYVGSISIFGRLTLGISGQLIPFDFDETNVWLTGNLGLKLKVLGSEVARWDVLETNIIYIVQEGEFVLFDEDLLEFYLLDADNYVPIDRSYLEDRTDWYDSGFSLMDETISIATSDLDVDVLQSSTYTDLKPQVVTSEDGTIMMLFTDDNAERADIDRTMLVYSLYDTDLKQWTEPKPVDDDGTADYGFSAHSVGEDIYLVWQNAKSLHEEGANITAISKNTEIMIAKFDAVMGVFDHIEQVTDNEQYENMPRVSGINGDVVVSWLTNSEDDIFQSVGENTVWYALKAEEDYDTTEPYEEEIDFSELTEEIPEEEEGSTDEEQGSTDEEQGSTAEEDSTTEEDTGATTVIVPDEDYVEPEPDPWTITSSDPIAETITSMAVGYMLEDGYVAYTTDEDGSTLTGDDQLIHLLNTQTGELLDYTDKANNVEFTQVHGYNAMTWHNQGLIYYALDPEYAPQLLFEEEANLENGYQLISDANGNMALLFTQNKDASSDAYLMLYDIENYEWGYPIAITDQDLYIRDFQGAYSDGMIVSIFNHTEVDQTDMQEINSLCSAIINERRDLILSDVDVNTYALEPLTDTPVSMTITNGGTQRVEQFIVSMYDDNDELVCQQIVDHPLKMGESTEVELNLTMPETITLATYRLEVMEEGQEDVFPGDNGYSFTVGEPHLVLSAANEPSSTEDIVVLTVNNLGYGSQGGSLVLLNDLYEVQQVLVEQFEPIDHDGEYSCAIAFDDYYFEDAFGSSFHFGIIPAGETGVSYSVSLYVDKVRPADSADIVIEDDNLLVSDDEVALQDATDKTVTGLVHNDSEADIENALLQAVAYDYRGVYLDTYTESISLSSEESYPFTATFLTELDIATVRILLLDASTMEPLVDVSDITLVYDVINH